MRVATWNVNNRGRDAAVIQGKLAQDSGVDLLLLQEANPNSVEVLTEAAGLDWVITAIDAGAPAINSLGRRRMAAIAGRGNPPIIFGVLDDVPLPERMVFVRLNTHFGAVTFASYHAPPGVTWGIDKVVQAHALLAWVNGTIGRLILGADANTPEIDHPDPDRVRTHWNTGKRRLNGITGDDVMFGGRPEHRLRDAYRSSLAGDSRRMAEVLESFPHGPLAVSHRTGKRRNFPGTPRRYDALWISPEFRFTNVQHDYEGAVLSGSDHALVTADLIDSAISFSPQGVLRNADT